MILPTCESLRARMVYDPATGHFYWRRTPKGAWWEGKRAGTVNKAGYVRLGFEGRQHQGHRLAWVYFYGEPAGCEIDHRNGNPSDNSIANLRKATSSEQKMNKRVQSNNRSGLKGAYYHACRPGKKWRSQIKAPGGRLMFLGYFHTAEEAHAAYCAAAPSVFGEFARVA